MLRNIQKSKDLEQSYVEQSILEVSMVEGD